MPRKKKKTENSIHGAPPKTKAEEWRDSEPEATEDLWLIPERDKSGEHIGDYHGNFVPQIANRLILRFTEPGDAVLDPFVGSGTTLIECRRLGRHGLGLELSRETCAIAKKRCSAEENKYDITTDLKCVDSASGKAAKHCADYLKKVKKDHFDLLLLHPPYADIINFSDEDDDLSHIHDPDEFSDKFLAIFRNVIKFITDDGFIGVVIGDKYEKGEVVPLGSILLHKLLATGMVRLKGFVVKDIQGNRAKRNLEHLWRYRALKGDFFIFKHEYVLVLQKHKSSFFGKSK